MTEAVTANSSAVVEFEGAIKDYGNNKIIGPADLKISKGEIVGFLGPNGSGKTTCIRLILGLIKPTSGSVKVNGLDPIRHHVEALKNVAYSPELPNIQTFLNPRQFLELVSHELNFQDKASRSNQISQVLELVGLQEYSEIKIGKLSKGMVQRLSIAQALMGSPQTLILDEPMIGLDPAGVAHFREVFKEFASQERGTVFMSSHIMGEVESLCTSVAIIHRGKILFKGPIDEVVQEVLDYSIIQLETSQLTSQTIQQLRKIPGIRQVNTKSNSKSEKLIDLEITVCGQNSDIRPQISDLIVKSGAKLYTIKPGENMLEKAYIEALKEKKVTNLE